MDVKIVSALIGVSLGWLLSQLTDLTKDKRRKRKVVESIYTELSDVNAWLVRMLHQTKYSLQLIVLSQEVTSVPGRIHTFIFDEHFHEICMDLSRSARIGLTDTYDSIKTINELINQLKELIDNQSGSNNKKLCKKFEAIYCIAYATEFKTRYLLNNRSGSMGDLAGVAIELDKKLHEELVAIVKEAKEMDLDEVKSKYYAE
ncbi:hypothetical protein [Oceanisphaera sp. KMM 10153]|uniref:hypothetical protein n=1 Tax=Oceanisphaera submarina TaxID=3390193 RepID=UPI0039769D03